ncbi:hypothetical protein QL285_083505 [Trifolium repens]|nr:hypothetical protein QL285_083505 [Trifolium repens]
MSICECVRQIGLREDFVLCDYPVYAEENICHAFHSCVPRCMSCVTCLRTRRLSVRLRQIPLDFIELVLSCVTHPVLSHRDCFGIVLCDFTWCYPTNSRRCYPTRDLRLL